MKKKLKKPFIIIFAFIAPLTFFGISIGGNKDLHEIGQGGLFFLGFLYFLGRAIEDLAARFRGRARKRKVRYWDLYLIALILLFAVGLLFRVLSR